ncbi:MAG: hypothetical protein ABL958_18655, partial [Bdellovibrionia bacterium]
MNRSALQKLVILALLAIMGGSFFLVKSRIKPFNITSILGENHPSLVKYKRHLERYNDELDILVMLEKTEGTFYEGDSLYSSVSVAGATFKKLPGLEVINSLYEQVHPVNRNGTMYLDSFFEDRKLTGEGMKILKEHSLYLKTYLEPGGQATMVYLRLNRHLGPFERMGVLENVFEVGRNLEKGFSGVKVHVLGTEVARYHFLREVVRSQAIILPAVLAIILGLL